MKVQRCEQQVITKNHPKYKLIDKMCFNSKNLYNCANYIIRQKFISDGEYISYNKMNSDLKVTEEYKNCMSQPANCTLRVLDKNWKSFFIAIKDWKKNPSKYLGMPKLPKYLKKDGRFLWMIPNNSVVIKDNNKLHFKMKCLNDYDWKCRNLGRLIQVRFVPRGTCYVMEIIYEIEVEDIQYDKASRVCSIDLGVNNFATITNNIGKQPIIINGKGIKSINQHYNKLRAKEQPRLMKMHGKFYSKKLDTISFKRFKRIKNYMHNTSRYVINWCLENEIDTIVIGKNDKWKQESSMNDKANQNFIQIPYEMFIGQLQYKGIDNCIKVIETTEEYTSGTSFLDNECPCRENYDKSRRAKRGLFKSNNGRMINSDVNGSFQIMKKVFSDTISYEIGANLTPIVINAAIV